MGSRKRYYSECHTYMPRQICQKPTYIRYHCCTGYEKATDQGAARGCLAGTLSEKNVEWTWGFYIQSMPKETHI